MIGKTITFTPREHVDLKRFLQAYADRRQADARIYRRAIDNPEHKARDRKSARDADADSNAALALIDKLEA